MKLKSLLSYFAREKGPHGKMQQQEALFLKTLTMQNLPK